MIALDTNILVRFFVDDPSDLEAVKQREIARQILRHTCYVPLTVILEMIWVLFSYYKLPKSTIVDIINFLLSMSNVTLQNADVVQKATALFLEGMDFADALHSLQVEDCEMLVTFDQKFVKKAKKLALNSPVINAQDQQF